MLFLSCLLSFPHSFILLCLLDIGVLLQFQNFIWQDFTHVYSEIWSYPSPLSATPLSSSTHTSPNSMFCFFVIGNPVCPFSAPHMWSTVGHPLDHGKPLSGYILNREWIIFSQTLSTANTSSVWNGTWRTQTPIYARSLTGLLLWRSGIAAMHPSVQHPCHV